MDSRFAIIFLLMSGTDTYLNDCPTDCTRQAPAPARLNLQYGDTYFQEDDIGEEGYISYDYPLTYGAVQPVAGVSLTSDDDLWVGAGGKWATRRTYDIPFFIEVSLMPGLYIRQDGPNLGFPVQFRGALGAGVDLGERASFGFFLDHRSNANTTIINPGLETWGLRFSYHMP